MGESMAEAFERLRVFLRDEVLGATTLSASIYCTVAPAWETDMQLTVISLTRTRIRGLDVCCESTCVVPTDFTFRDANTALLVFESLSQCDCTFSDFNVRFSFCPYSPSYFDGRRAEWLAENGFVRKALASVSACSRLATLGITFSVDGNWMSPGRGQCHGILESWGRHFLETDFPNLGSWRNPSFEKLTLTALEHQSSGSRMGDAESFAVRNFSALPDGDYKLTRAYCFSRDSALEFWTLTTSRSSEGNLNHHVCFPHEDFVTTFPSVEHSAGAWNAVNKILVLRTTLSNRVRGLCRKAMVRLVTNHAWLDARLEAGGHPFFRDGITGGTGAVACALSCDEGKSSRALACSPAVEEFGPYRCTLAELQELVRVFIPDVHGRRQANTSLSTLKLCLRETSPVHDYLTALKPLLESSFTTTTTMIKRVELCYQDDRPYHEPWRLIVAVGSSSQISDAGDHQADSTLSILDLSKTMRDCTVLLNTFLDLNTTAFKHVKLSWPEVTEPILHLIPSQRKLMSTIQKNLLKQKVQNELRRNTCLQSLCVGWWEVVRVTPGDRWEMKYTGPCFGSPGIQEEYVVKVRMR